MAGLEGCGKSRPHRDSIPGPSSPQQVAMPTELTRFIETNVLEENVSSIVKVGNSEG